MFKKLLIFFSFFFISAIPAFASCTINLSPDHAPVNTNTNITATVSHDANSNNIFFSTLSGDQLAVDLIFQSVDDIYGWQTDGLNYSGTLFQYDTWGYIYPDWVGNPYIANTDFVSTFTVNESQNEDIFVRWEGGENCTKTLRAIVPPAVDPITVSPNPVQINNSTTASANFTDPDTTSTHTASWNWGDGSTPTTGTVTESNGSGSVSDSHTYTSAGVYAITLTVTNNNGATGTQTFQYVSVYNPTSQGLFSAGQKYTSPAGAYAANSSLTGNVKFGLSYKYQGTVPTGTRQFSMDFNTANFHFNATSVNSLVIANGMGTLTGTGTLNGSGSYNFLVTGSESANTIRIQITDPSNNNNVIYDTQPGAAATTTPTTSVTGHVLAH